MRATAKSSSTLKSLGVTYASPAKPALPDGEMNQLMDAMRAKRDCLTLSAKRLLQFTASKITTKYSGMSKRLDAKMCNMTELNRRKKIVDKILAFYDEKGVHLPGKRSVCVRTQTQKKVLTMSLSDLYQVYTDEHPEEKVSFITFCKKRPAHIVLFTKTPFRQCLCEVCINPMLKMKVLNGLLPEPIESLPALISHTICCNDGVPRMSCLERQSSECGVAMFRIELESKMEAGSTDVKWKRWEKAGEPGKTRVALVEKSGPMDVLLDELWVRPEWR